MCNCCLVDSRSIKFACDANFTIGFIVTDCNVTSSPPMTRWEIVNKFVKRNVLEGVGCIEKLSIDYY